MQCCCCLNSRSEEKIAPLNARDKKVYFQLIKIEMNVSGAKICKVCREQLKALNDFYLMCVKSYNQLKSQIEVPCRSIRTRSKVVEDLPNEELTESIRAEEDMCESIREEDTMSEQELHIDTVELIDEEHLEPPEAKKDQEPAEAKKKNFLCIECGIPFITKQRLQVHSFTHSGIKKFKCTECEKLFATKFRLKSHSRIHTGERPFVCEFCSMTFSHGNALKCHRRVHTREKPFVCQYCSKSFSQNTTLKTHMAALHLGKNVECDVEGCGKKFTRRSYLILHQRDHAGERKYSCDRCPNLYKQKSHLDRHIESSHLKIRHRCSFPSCNAEYSKSWSLKMHMFVHSESKPYVCSLCETGTGFQRRDKLLKHLAKCHPNESVELKEAFEIKDPTENLKISSSSNEAELKVSSSTPTIHTTQNVTFTLIQSLPI